jgi:hypothetical protein
MNHATPTTRRFPPVVLLIAGVLLLAYAMSGADPSADIQQPAEWPPTTRSICFGLAGIAGILAGCVGLALRKAQLAPPTEQKTHQPT